MNAKTLLLLGSSFFVGELYHSAYKGYKNTCNDIATAMQADLDGKKLIVNGDTIKLQSNCKLLLTEGGDTINISATNKSIKDLFVNFPSNTYEFIKNKDEKVNIEQAKKVFNSLFEIQINGQPYDLKFNIDAVNDKNQILSVAKE